MRNTFCLNTRIDTYPYSPQDFEREINKLLNTVLWEQMDGNADFAAAFKKIDCVTIWPRLKYQFYEYSGSLL